MSVKVVMCQHCGATMKIDTEKAYARCQHCGAELVIKDIITNNITNNYIEKIVPVKQKKVREPLKLNFHLGSLIFSLIVIAVSLFQLRAVFELPEIYESLFSFAPILSFFVPLAILLIVFRVVNFHVDSVQLWLVVLSGISFWGTINLYNDKNDMESAVVAVLIGAVLGVVLLLALHFMDFKDKACYMCLGVLVVLWIEAIIEGISRMEVSSFWHLLPIIVIAIVALFSSKDIFT